MSARAEALDRSAAALAAAAALSTATPVAAWWLIGDRLYDRSIENPDFMVRPPSWDPATVDRVGVAATVIVVAAVAGLVSIHRRGRLSQRVVMAAPFLAAAGVVLAVGYRVVTAPGVGANIGGGLAVMFGGPAVLTLVILAVLAAAGVFDRSRRSAPRGRPLRWPAMSETKPVVTIPAGDPPTTLQMEDLLVGDGTEATAGKVVMVHYVGVAWSNGKQFDASWDRGESFDFRLGGGQVIQGWDKGVAGMKVGGRRRLTIPPDMGYGARGAGGVIKGGETLVFVVDLLGVD